MKRVSRIIFLLILILNSCEVEKQGEENITEPEVFDFSDRKYTTYAEGISSNQTPAPVLLVLHGAGSSIQSMIQATNFNVIAGDAGFLVVYPEGYQALWNFGSECEMAHPERPDDIHFIKYVLDELGKKYNIDEKRIYVTGFSMGGYFTYYLAAKMPNTFAAIAPVAATMPRYLSNIQNVKSIPVLVELGTKDSSVPYEGSGSDNCSSLSGMETIKFWADINGCDETPTTTYLPDNGIDYLQIRIDEFNKCNAPFETKLISVEGGSHRWYNNAEINISQIIFDFFGNKSL